MLRSPSLTTSDLAKTTFQIFFFLELKEREIDVIAKPPVVSLERLKQTLVVNRKANSGAEEYMDKQQRDLLVFGYGLGIIAAIFGIGGLIKHGIQWPSVVLLICCIMFISVTALNWQALKPGYTGWMKVAHLIGGVITTVILAVVFFLVFTPVALVIRLFGKDHLERKIDPAAKSYWHHRPAAEVDKDRCLQQF